jgi:chaperonin GroES
MNLKPLGDRIVVKVLESEERTKSGIVIPDTAKEKPQKATVVAVGPGKINEENGNRIPMDLKVGQTVVFAKYGGTEIKLDGDEYLILSERDVLAVLEG